ncbi:amyloid beta A4 precursor protein-binding family B member 1-interacting protein-like isoform X2 [Betta splendens]|uniref:Amyloid beta A4 precursor protein-binding family B member 1-interacting protein n=1 Tax=Betta splendens TaxID=158456 RepID=A0A9W2XDB5_BETSP|nr:amyloid beta A4 precursor protein-binding family B member 1-interacting protein-like isoform X2 [Betta splendens]
MPPCVRDRQGSGSFACTPVRASVCWLLVSLKDETTAAAAERAYTEVKNQKFALTFTCVRQKSGGATKMDDIDAMFSHLLGEMDHLSQSLTPGADPPDLDPASIQESTLTIGFTDLNESLNQLEDTDLDALVADLRSKATVQDFSAYQQNSLPDKQSSAAAMTQAPNSDLSELQTKEPQTKAEKIKLALEKLKEAKVRKLIVKVLMGDGSSKTLMVDERQAVREVLSELFEKTHCDRSIDWSLCETNPELQIERCFEDHEGLVEPLSVWTRYSQNKLYFVQRPQKYVMFTDPQLFYMWKKKKTGVKTINEEAKQLLIKENFGGSALIVPDLEGTLHLKEDGKRVWKPRYFVLRASGIYFVPKGKTKSSSDLVCFARFEKVNVYTTHDYKQKYRAPTNFCFVLKYGAVLYRSYEAAVKRASTLRTCTSAAHKEAASGRMCPVLHTSPPKNPDVGNYPYEPPPDFIPPPPPGHAEVTPPPPSV